MSFKDTPLKNEYRSLIDNVVQDFYLPLLHDAVSYKRAVGFFSSSSLVEISKGIAQMASAGGKIQIVASPYLSDDDIAAIKKGYAERNRIIENAILRQISDERMDYFSMQRLNLLACLIADGIMDIRIAYTESKSGIGMYHEKMGLIEDGAGNIVAFSGSMNESATAMAINYETIDVFRSWGSENEVERVKLNNGAHIKTNDILHPLLNQVLIRTDDDNSKAVVQIFGQLRHRSQPGVSLASASSHIKCVDLLVKHKLATEGIRGKKYSDYKLYRPQDEVIDSIRGYIFSVFESFVNHTTVIREYLSENSEEKAKKFRNSEGGNLLFRPIAFTEYFEAAFWLQDRGGDTTYDDAFISLNTVDLDIGKAPWLGLVWDGSKIISKASKTTIRYLLVFLADSTVMTEKDIQKLVRDYASGTNRSEAESALALGRESL